MKTITMKFGGTSVGSPEAVQNVTGIVRRAVDAGDRPVLIVSAMSGVTDALLKTVKMAAAGDKWGYLSVTDDLRDRHSEVLNLLVKAGADRTETLKQLNHLLDNLVELCNAINILGEDTPRIIDSVVSFGERLSSVMVAAVLREYGLSARAYDAGDLLVTDDTHQNAEPLWGETQARIQQLLLPAIATGIIPVITGFIGKTQRGIYTTLGRGGSDFSAAIFADFLNSDEFIIWTDVDGVMTVDPRIDTRARTLSHVSYQEVGELAFYGAKVLHPKTVQPIIDKQIPMWVRNTFNPDHPGTLIGPNGKPSSTIVKAVTSIKSVSLLTVSGRGMLGVPGIAGRTFLATAKSGASVLMISQSSSEQSFCFTVVDDKAVAVKHAVEQELSAEIARHNVDKVDIMTDVVIVTVVGAGMRGTPGIAGKVFTVMGDNRINVLTIAQGSSECSISFVIHESDLQTAVLRLHDLALETVKE